MSKLSPLGREILRKLVHLLELPIILGYHVISSYFSPQVGILSLTALLLLLLEIEYIRVDYHTSIGTKLTQLFSKFVLRKHERDNITSSIFFVISTIICFSAFDYSIAIAALLVTVFGDTVAAIMGIAFGKTKIFRNKSYVGTFSGLVVNIIVAVFIFPSRPDIAVPMAITASLVEMLTRKLDDNLTVPLFSGFVGQIIVIMSQAII